MHQTRIAAFFFEFDNQLFVIKLRRIKLRVVQGGIAHFFHGGKIPRGVVEHQRVVPAGVRIEFFLEKNIAECPVDGQQCRAAGLQFGFRFEVMLQGGFGFAGTRTDFAEQHGCPHNALVVGQFARERKASNGQFFPLGIGAGFFRLLQQLVRFEHALFGVGCRLGKGSGKSQQQKG
jgi:hypothetical protein